MKPLLTPLRIMLLLLMSLLWAMPCQAFEMPPQIQAIMDKAATGAGLTEEEQKAMEDWARSAAEASLKNLGLPGAGMPEEVQQALEQGGASQEVSPDQEKAIQAWGESLGRSAGAAAKAMEAKSGQMMDALGQAVCPKPSPISLPTAPLSREDYLEMAVQLSETYGQMAKKGKAEVDKTLSGKTATDAANLGAALVMMGAGSAGVYATALAAIQDPDDPVTAVNLAVTLRGMGDLVPAAKALGRAEALKPDTALVAINLAWCHFDLGQMADARRLFDKALDLSPDLPEALQGLGSIYTCQGLDDKATEYLLKSLMARYSRAAAQAYGVASARLSQQQEAAGKTGGPGKTALPPPPPAPREFRLPSRILSGSIGRDGALSGHLPKKVQDLQKRIKQLHQEAGALREKTRREYEAMGADKDGTTLYRTFEKEQFLFDQITDMVMIYAPEREAAHQKSVRDQESVSGIIETSLARLNTLVGRGMACGQNTYCQDQVAYEICLSEKTKNKDLYDITFGIHHALFEAFKANSQDYWAFTDPILEQILQPTHNALLNKERELQVLNYFAEAQGLAMEPAAYAAAYSGLECVPPEPPAQDEGGLETPAKRSNCGLKQPVKISLIVASFEFGCQKVKLEVGQGLKVSVEHDYKGKNTTFFAGGGVDGGIPGALSVGGAAGFYMTVDGSNQISDFGMESSMSKGFGFEESSFSTRIGMTSGPTMDTGTTTTFGL